MLKLLRTTFQRNEANGTGGAIFAQEASEIIGTDVRMSENTAQWRGGAVFLDTLATLRYERARPSSLRNFRRPW